MTEYYNNPELLFKRINEYFDYCDSLNNEINFKTGLKILQKPYTVMGLASYLKIDRDNLYLWSKDNNNVNFGIIKETLAKIEAFQDENTLNNSLSTIGSIFSRKVYFGLDDGSNGNVVVNNTFNQITDAELDKQLEAITIPKLLDNKE